jgi:16S rRNA (adenine1518-N6/adenine1519-N6)-dimethyltransferase
MGYKDKTTQQTWHQAGGKGGNRARRDSKTRTGSAAAHGLVTPKKNLGQHFLTDLGIAKAIADTVDAYPDAPVLEVGPGMGVMTQFLIPKPRPLKVVEIDRESVAFLNANYSDLQIIGGDFLKMDLSTVFDGQPFVLTGNYPYDISSQIFFKMIDNRELIPCCTGMIQREVALRIASKPGNKAYGILSVLLQAWYDCEYLFTVDENVFNPPPKVKSAVIRMTRNATENLGCDEKLFRRVVKTTFNQRRKMLRGSLRQLFTSDNVPAPEFFAQDIMTMRPEQLSVADFVDLTNLVASVL